LEGTLPIVEVLKSAEVVPFVQKWVRSILDDGVKILCIEGLMGSGKSYLLGELQGSFKTIDLDEFLPQPANYDRTWLEQVIEGGALTAIEKAYSCYEFTTIGGVQVAPMLQAVTNINQGAIRKAYIKKMSQRGEAIYWDDGDSLGDSTLPAQGAFSRSVDEYHLEMTPWNSADLVIERIADD